MGKKRRSRILDDEEFRESFGFSQNSIRRNNPVTTILKTHSRDRDLPCDSGSWTSRDELGSSGDVLDSTGDVLDSAGDYIETYSSSGVGSESSELIATAEDRVVIVSDMPLAMQLQINRRASRYKPIRIKIPAGSHEQVQHAGLLYHKVGRRKWDLGKGFTRKNKFKIKVTFYQIFYKYNMSHFCLQS